MQFQYFIQTFRPRVSWLLASSIRARSKTVDSSDLIEVALFVKVKLKGTREKEKGASYSKMIPPFISRSTQRIRRKALFVSGISGRK